MPMTLEQLIKLYILQKNHHKDSQNPEHKKIYEDEYSRLLVDTEIVREDVMAPSLFKDQPSIPFVLFRPKDDKSNKPLPLIVHTHGGPNVYMDKNGFHAEIAYFLSHGYCVACPNYRGSSGYPIIGEDPVGWETWEEKSKGKHHIYGPQDVYAVTKSMQQSPFIDPKKIFLRGGSFGSFINSHLLAAVKKGTFENIFKGAHLSGGVKYPVATSMPDDVPLLITHSTEDNVAPFADVRIFMEKILQKKLSYELDGVVANSVQIFIAQHGNHHLIDPQLELDDEGSKSYQELVCYLKHTTAFIEALNADKPYQVIDTYDQFKEVMSESEKDTDKDIVNEVLLRAHSYKYIRHQNTSKTNTSIEDKSSIDSLALTSASKNVNYYGPTMALLKLQLGKQFTGDIRTDLNNYIQNHFAPINWIDRTKLINAGNSMCDDSAFFDQIVMIIEKEETYLKKNPNHMVMYHTAENNCLQLYSFINLWQAILKGNPKTALPVIEELRLYDFMKNTFDDIEVFLNKMRLKLKPEGVFNNIPGFADRAIACNPTVISNAHSTASCSLWWYFNAKESERSPVVAVVTEMLKVLGIYSPERMSRYLQLFERQKQSLQDVPQALLQQIFVTEATAKKAAYMCQIWGEEFKNDEMELRYMCKLFGEEFEKNKMELHSPTIIKELIEAPEKFEKKLRINQEAFTNFGDCEGFGDTAKGFNYANALQIRYLPRNNASVVTNSYFRSDEFHQNFVAELSQLISEDYADYLAYGNDLPDFILQGADAAKKLAYSQSELSFFQPQTKINYEAIYLQQCELYKGLVQNPGKETYGSIISLSSEEKAKLQIQIRKSGKESRGPVFPYSLCLYLKGYTYYDLIAEAATALFLIDHKDPVTNNYYKENFDLVMKMIDLFSNPSSVNEIPMNGGLYSELYNVMQSLKEYDYISKKHQFIQPESGQYYDSYLFSLELTSAITCILKHARLAKEKSYGHDISEATLALYY